VDLVGERSFADQILGGAEREIGKGVGGGVENIRVAGEIAIEDSEEIKRIVGGVVGHGAVQAEETDAFFEIAVGDLVDGFFQKRERFGAVAGLCERDGALGSLQWLSSGSGSFRRRLGIGERKEEE
jgi:hypothetical protein